MSAETPGQAERWSDYVERLFAREDALLVGLRAEIERQEIPQIHISAEVGRALQLLLVAVGAKRVLEIGTLGGYSAIWMARALPPDGRLITLELEPDRAELARTFVMRAQLESVVEVRVGDAHQLLPELVRESRGTFDAVFIDADKQGYPRYLEHALELVRPGGLILGDNAFLSGRVLDVEGSAERDGQTPAESPPESPAEEDASAVAMHRFNRQMAEHPRLLSTVLPIRDGLAVGVVRKEQG